MDNKELEGLLLFAGVGLFVLFLLFSLFSVWWNGVFFSWLTFKYLALMGAAALALVLEDSARRRYAIAFAAFLGLLAYADQMTFSRGQITTLARARAEAIEDKAEARQKSLLRTEDEQKELKELRRLMGVLRDPPAELKDANEKEKRDKRIEEIKKQGEELEKKWKENATVTVSDIEDMTDLMIEVEEAKEKVAEKESSLVWAKGYDAFILLGGFLMLAGALIGGAKDDDDGYTSYGAGGFTASQYTPPAPTAPAGGSAPAGGAASGGGDAASTPSA